MIWLYIILGVIAYFVVGSIVIALLYRWSGGCLNEEDAFLVFIWPLVLVVIPVFSLIVLFAKWLYRLMKKIVCK